MAPPTGTPDLGAGGAVSTRPTPVRTGFAVADDGTRLYWRAVGEGPPIVCCNGVGVSIFFWKYIVEHYCRTHTVLLWDYRAHGRSDRPADIGTADLSIPRHARDLESVMGAAGIGSALLMGHSMGVQVVLEFHRHHPARVLALVPLLGTAGRALDTFYNYSGSPKLFQAASRFIDRLGDRSHYIIRPLMESPLAWWVARKASLVDPLYCRKEDLLPYMRHLASLDMRVFLHTVLLTQEHDAWDTLAGIRVPTLVIAAERDTFTPMWLSRKMVKSIPGAEFLVLAEGSHAALIEQPDTIQHRIDRFLAERRVFSG